MAGTDSELRDLWAQYARESSDARLVTLAAVGLVGVVAFVVLIFVDATRVARWWPLVLPVAFAGAFGVWGVADRELLAAADGGSVSAASNGEVARASGSNGGASAASAGTGASIAARGAVSWRGWIMLRGVASVVAGGAGIAAMLEVLRVGLGTWIS